VDVIFTERMTLVPATAALLRTELSNRAAFGDALGAAIPVEWPPESLADAVGFFAQRLEAHPEETGWLAWYGIARDQPTATLIASGGFFGPPTEGAVEIGYSVLPAYEGRGYAGDMMAALIGWAFTRGVETVAAETSLQNTRSLKLLQRLAFTRTGDGRDVGFGHFERRRLS
jgi:ribosomal-protein-alanine N-acetyltransferase